MEILQIFNLIATTTSLRMARHVVILANATMNIVYQEHVVAFSTMTRFVWKNIL